MLDVYLRHGQVSEGLGCRGAEISQQSSQREVAQKKKKFSACSMDEGQESIVISDLELNISPL